MRVINDEAEVEENKPERLLQICNIYAQNCIEFISNRYNFKFRTYICIDKIYSNVII